MVLQLFLLTLLPFREPLTRGEVLIVQCLHNMTQNVHSWRASSPSVQVPLIIQVHAVRHTLYTLSSLPVCKIKYDNLYLVATDNERNGTDTLARQQ